MKHVALTLAALWLSGLANAQPFTGDFLVAGEWYRTGAAVAKVDRNTMTVSTFVSTFPTTTSRFLEIVHAEDNTDFYVLAQGTTSPSVYRVDATGFVFRTVFDGATTSVVSGARDMFLDQNGDLILVDYSNGLFRVNIVTGNLSTVLTSPKFTAAMWAATVDIDTGSYLIGATSRWVWRYDFTSGGLSSVLQGPGTGNFRYSIEQDLSTGKLYMGSCCGARCIGTVDLALYEFDLRGSSATVLVGCQPVIRAVYGHRFDRRVNLPGSNVMYASVSGFGNAGQTSGLFTITTQGVVTSLSTYGPAANGVLTTYGLEIGGSRNLASFRITPPNRRGIAVTFPEPNLAGKAYVAALGLSGVNPSVSLPGGRMLNLVPDDLTRLSLTNQLPGVWNPGPGVLNASGRATLTLDVNALGGAARGIPVWVSVIVLDASAPGGIAAVAETHVIRLE